MNVGTITALLRLRDINFAAGLAKAQVKMAALGKQFKKVGKQMASTGKMLTQKLTLPLLALGGASLKLSADFETGLTKMITLVGLTGDEVDGFKDKILALSGETAVAPKELADAMFFVTSAGLRGAAALEALEASAKAAALGLGETETIADAVTSAMNAYGQENLSATRATNIMALAIRAGKLEASQLAPVLGRLLPTASAMGVEFEQVAGILAVMSRTGLDAAEASTSLSSVMTTLLKPTGQARKALTAAAKATGMANLDFRSLRETARGPGGLIQVMRDLEAAFEGNDEGLVQVVPNVRAFRGVMNVLAQDSSIVADVMNVVASETDVLNEGMIALEKTIGFKFKRAINDLRLAFLKFGDVLVPVFEKVTNKVSEWGEALQALTPQQRETTVKVAAFGAAAGPVISILAKVATSVGILMIALGGAGGAAGVGLAGGLAASTLAVAALVAVVAGALLAWKPFREFVKNLAVLVWELGKSLVMLADKFNVLENAGKAVNWLTGGLFGHTLQLATDSVVGLTGSMKNATAALRRNQEQMKAGMPEYEAEREAKRKLLEQGKLLFQQMLLDDSQISLEIALRGTLHGEMITQIRVTRELAAAEAIARAARLEDERINGQLIESTREYSKILKDLADDIMPALKQQTESVRYGIVTLDGAIGRLGIQTVNVEQDMRDFWLATTDLTLTHEQLAGAAQRLYDKFAANGLLTEELKLLFQDFGAGLEEVKVKTDDTTKAWGEFFSIIKTGITWVDKLVEGIFHLIDSLMKKEGLQGALTGIGEMISGIFGGKDSKLGQVAGGIVTKLGGFDFGALFGKGTEAAGTGGGGGIGGWLTKNLGSLFGAGGAAAAGTTGLTGAAAIEAGLAMSAATAAGTATAVTSGITLGGGAAAAGGGLSLAGIGSFMTGPYGIAILAGIALWKSGALGKASEVIKGFFGPDKAELEARKVVHSVDSVFKAMMKGHAAEATMTKQWQINNIAIGDSYLAMGFSQAEAEAATRSMHDLQKKSPEVAQKTIDSILEVVMAAKAQMEETGKDLLTLRNDNINAAIREAQATQAAIDDAAKAAVAAVKETATAATEETKTSIAGTLISVVSACGGMKKVAKESAQEINESFTRSLESVKDVASSTATKVKEAFDIDLTAPIDSFGKRMADMATGGAASALAAAGASAGGGGGGGWEDANAMRLEALMERLPTIMERAVKHGLQTTGRKVRN